MVRSHILGFATLLLAPGLFAQTYNLGNGGVNVGNADIGTVSATTNITVNGTTTSQVWAWDATQQMYVDGQGNTMTMNANKTEMTISAGHPSSGIWDMTVPPVI